MKRIYLLFVISFIYALSGSLNLDAQTVDDFTINLQVTPSTCLHNGSVDIIVKSKDNYRFTGRYDLLDENNKSITNMQGGDFRSHKFGNLRKGTYTTKVILYVAGKQIKLPDQNVIIESNYSPASSTVTIQRHPLNDCVIKGIKINGGIVKVGIKDGTKPYRVIVSGPSLNSKEFEFNDEKTLYDLAGGDYTFDLYDQCGMVNSVKISLDPVAKDYPIARNDYPIYDFASVPDRSNCNWFKLKHKVRLYGDGQENDKLYPYMSNMDTLMKYFDYTFLMPNQSLNEAKWFSANDFNSNDHPYSFYTEGGYKAFYCATERSEEILKNPRNMPRLYMKIKGSNQIPEYVNAFVPSAFPSRNSVSNPPLAFTPIVDCSSGRYSFKVEVKDTEDRFFCYPLKIQLFTRYEQNNNIVYNKINELIIKPNQTQYNLDNPPKKHKQFDDNDGRGSLYVIKISDNSGFQWDEIPLLSLTNPTYKLNKTASPGAYLCGGDFACTYSITTESGGNLSFAGKYVTLIEAPEGFKIQDGFQKGWTERIPNNYDKNIIYPFSPFKQFDIPYEVKFPNGHYRIKISQEQNCPKTDGYIDFDVNIPKHDYRIDMTKFRPKVVKSPDRCGYVRIYPYPNDQSLDDIMSIVKDYSTNPAEKMYPLFYFPDLTKDGGDLNKPTKESMDTIIGSPTLKDNGGSFNVWNLKRLLAYYCDYYPNDSKPWKNEDIWFEVPERDGYINLAFTINEYNDDQPIAIYKTCFNPIKIPIKTYPLGYDTDTYLGYSCPDSTSGKIRITPINYGNKGVSVSLISNQSRAVIYSGSYGPKNSGLPLEFDLSRTEFRTLISQQGDNKRYLIPNSYKLIIKDTRCGSTFEDDIYVYNLNSPDFIKIKKDDLQICEGDQLTLELQNLPENMKAQWEFTNVSQRPIGRKVVLEGLTSKNTGWVKVTIGGIYCGRETKPTPITFRISVSPKELWWREDAASQDWNDVRNWCDKDGNAIEAVPAKCTIVHIPSRVDKYYPDLAYTTHKYFGDPICDEIYFHYGAKLGNPQRLKYNKAHVDYNFGYFDNQNKFISKSVSGHRRANEIRMERDRWYMISAPLKNMYTGDFSFAGYPMTYCRYVKSNSVGSNVTDATFTNTFNGLNALLSWNEFLSTPTFNALAFKVNGDIESAKNNTSNLNKVSGILQIPYYEIDNQEEKNARPLHHYDKKRDASTMYYFRENDRIPLNRSEELFRAGIDSYKFIYESLLYDPNDGNTVSAIGQFIKNGIYHEGYEVNLKDTKENEWFMLGNPFMSPFSFDKLVEFNSDVIYPYYYIFTKEGWSFYNKSDANAEINQLSPIIEPLQSILVRKKAIGKNDKVQFPTDKKTSVLVSPNENKDATIRSAKENKSDILTIHVSTPSGYENSAYLSSDESLINVPALTNSEFGYIPTIYLVGPDGSEGNVLEVINKDTDKLGLGISYSLNGEMNLRFNNINPTKYEVLTLIDKVENVTQNMIANSTYHFINNPTFGSDRFELRLKLKGSPTRTENAHVNELNVKRIDNRIIINSDIGINSLMAYDMQGRCFSKQTDLENKLESSINVPIGIEMLVLDIRLSDGSRKLKKIAFN